MPARRFFRQGLSRVVATPFALALLLTLSLGANASSAASLLGLGSCPMEKACKADCCPSAPSLCTDDGAAHEIVLEGAAAPFLKAGAPALPPATLWHAPAQFAAAPSVRRHALTLSDPEKSPRSPSRAFLSSWIV